MPSLDIERDEVADVWPDAPRARLQSEEAYTGVSSGFCPGGGCGSAPLDWGKISYDGPIRFFGAGGIGGTGGCALHLPTGPFDAIDAMVPGQAMDVMAPEQSLVCLLPVDSAIAQPTGSCPRPGVGER